MWRRYLTQDETDDSYEGIEDEYCRIVRQGKGGSLYVDVVSDWDSFPEDEDFNAMVIVGRYGDLMTPLFFTDHQACELQEAGIIAALQDVSVRYRDENGEKRTFFEYTFDC